MNRKFRYYLKQGNLEIDIENNKIVFDSVFLQAFTGNRRMRKKKAKKFINNILLDFILTCSSLVVEESSNASD